MSPTHQEYLFTKVNVRLRPRFRSARLEGFAARAVKDAEMFEAYNYISWNAMYSYGCLYISKYIGFLMDSYGFLELAFLRKLMLGGKNIVLTMSGLGRACGVGWWRFQQDASREALMDFSCLS